MNKPITIAITILNTLIESSTNRLDILRSRLGEAQDSPVSGAAHTEELKWAIQIEMEIENNTRLKELKKVLEE